jgi:hypothetical protein
VLATAPAIDVAAVRAAYDEIGEQQTTLMLHGYDVQALAGLLEVLAEHRRAGAFSPIRILMPLGTNAR